MSLTEAQARAVIVPWYGLFNQPVQGDTASLASCDVGIVAQEASTRSRTPITIRTGLTSASEHAGLAL
jgi:hypothetical protein